LVTEQHLAGGMPEWVRILIGAGIGALFSILSSIAMEFVKPALLARRTKHTIREQVTAELTRNMTPLEGHESIFQSRPYRNRDLQSTFNMWRLGWYHVAHHNCR
jgi:hypothetical protein